MSNFFEQVQTQLPPDHQAFLEALEKGHHFIATFPSGTAFSPLYQLPALYQSSGLLVVVCPDQNAVQKRVAHFRQLGIEFPMVAALEGRQMPHEERPLLAALKEGQIRLLYTDVERFTSIRFVQALGLAMAQQDVRMLLIEQAQQLLPDFSGYERYAPVLKTLKTFRKLPPLSLLCQPIPPHRIRQLAKIVGIQQPHTYFAPIETSEASITVLPVLTRFQKFKKLGWLLAGKPDKGQVGKIHQPGSVIIHTSGKMQALSVYQHLLNEGFEKVHLYHSELEAEEKDRLTTLFRQQHHVVLIRWGQGISDSADFIPPNGQPLMHVFWEPCTNLEEVFGAFYSTPLTSPPTRIHGVALHLKEDYLRLLSSMEREHPDFSAESHSRKQGLRLWRKWILSPLCRKETLLRFWRGEGGSVKSNLPSGVGCGHCDVCMSPRPPFWKQLLNPFLF